MSCLREAGELLRAVADADDRMLISRRILDAAYRLDGLRMAEAQPRPAPVPQPPAHPRHRRRSCRRPVVPIESLLLRRVAVVPIESLSYDEPVVPIESLGDDEPVPIDRRRQAGGLEASFRTFDRLRRERGGRVRHRSRRSSAARSPPTTPRRREGTVTVEIGTLCYRGRAALERAAAVRQQFADELARNGGLDAIQPLLQELLDLVPLALAES